MNPINWIRRINAELSAARERSRIERFNRAMRKRRVVLPRPKPDERSSIEQHRRIVTP